MEYQIKKKQLFGILSKTRPMLVKKMIQIYLVFLLLIVSTGCINQSSQSATETRYQPITTSPTTNIVTQTEITREQYTEKAITVSYDDLFRNNEIYLGKTVYFKGKIIQVISYGNNYYLFRIAIIDAKYPNSVILVWYSGQRFLENDVVEFWGTVSGIENYETVFGQQVSAPSLNAKYLGFPGSYQKTEPSQPTSTSSEAPIEVLSYTHPIYNYTLNYPETWQIKTKNTEYGENAYVEFIPIVDEGAYPINRFSIEYRGTVGPISSEEKGTNIQYGPYSNVCNYLVREMEKDPTMSFSKTQDKESWYALFGDYSACGQSYTKENKYGQNQGFGDKWITVVHGREFIITSERSNCNFIINNTVWYPLGTCHTSEMDIMIETLKFY